MAGYKLLIVDNSEDFPLALSELMQKKYQVKYCLDGKEALSLLCSFQPDVLLLELAIPNLDGISLLHEAAANGIHPLVITFTQSYNDYMIDALTRLDVSYWMVKPCDLHHTARHIEELLAHRKNQQHHTAALREQVETLLFSLGFIPKHHGLAYLQDAIVMEILNPDQPLTKLVYPAIGEKYNCSKETVEHSIRTAVHHAWENGNHTVWSQYFLPAADGNIPRPSNGAMIFCLVQHIRNLANSQQSV